MINTPSINNYIESFLSPEGRFRTLAPFTVVRKKASVPVHNSNPNYVTFRLRFGDRREKIAFCMLKGRSLNNTHYNTLSRYIRDLGNPHLPLIEVFPKEVYVFTDDGEGDYYDIVLKDYTKGRSLETAMCELAAKKDTTSLEILLRAFSGFAASHLSKQEFAHNHLRPAYVRITSDHRLLVTELSVMTIPGSDNWESDRDNDIYPLAVMTLLLYIVSKNPAICSYGTEYFTSIGRISEYMSGLLTDDILGLLPDEVKALYDMVSDESNCRNNREKVISLIEMTGELATRPAREGVISGIAAETQKPYELCGPFNEGLACAVKEGRYGYVNRGGETVIPFSYDHAWDFEEGLALVKDKEMYGLTDKTGRQVFKTKYEDISWTPENGVIFTCHDGKWKVANRSGEYISRFVFDDIGDFSHGLACVRRDRKWGYIDRRGMIAIPVDFDYASSFGRNGLANVKTATDNYYIDTEGKRHE